MSCIAHTQTHLLTHEQLPILNAFLKRFKQGKAAKGEHHFVIYLDSKLVGTARLIPLESLDNQQACQYWLRGVFIDPDYRHQGLASILVSELANWVKTQSTSADIFAFPLAHLLPLYAPLGYTDCSAETLPKPLQERWSRAQQQGKTWLCMVNKLT